MTVHDAAHLFASRCAGFTDNGLDDVRRFLQRECFGGDDAEMSRVMTTLVKQRRKAARAYQKAQRDNLAGKELQKMTSQTGWVKERSRGSFNFVTGVWFVTGSIIDTW